MNAAEAKKTTKSVLIKLQRDHEKERKTFLTNESRSVQKLWKERGPVLIAQIEGHIKEAAAKGHNCIDVPTKINPNGEAIFYLQKPDQPLHDVLMDHFRKQGFEVEEYQYFGLEITW